MSRNNFEKVPAFFRAMSPELFFEAEALETTTEVATENVSGSIGSNDLSAKLDELLATEKSS